jgi:hypothetical protein
MSSSNFGVKESNTGLHRMSQKVYPLFLFPGRGYADLVPFNFKYWQFKQ